MPISAGIEAREVSSVQETDRVVDYDQLTRRETEAFHRLLDGETVRNRQLIESLSNSVVRFTDFYRIGRF